MFKGTWAQHFGLKVLIIVRHSIKCCYYLHHQVCAILIGRFGTTHNVILLFSDRIWFLPKDSMIKLLCLVCQILVADNFSALWPPTHCSPFFAKYTKAPSDSRAIADKAHFRGCPVISSRLKVRHSDWAGNPLQPTFTRKHHAFQPLSSQLSIKAWYFVSFLSKLSSILSSHGTGSYINLKKYLDMSC